MVGADSTVEPWIRSPQAPDDEPVDSRRHARRLGRLRSGFPPGLGQHDRLKGNSSLSAAWRAGNHRLPCRLNMDQLEDAHPEIKNQTLHGFDEPSMAPGFLDSSLIREKAAADIFRMAGGPAAYTAFYRVMFDFGEGPKYDGVDTMVEGQFGENTGNLYKRCSSGTPRSSRPSPSERTARSRDTAIARVPPRSAPLSVG